MVIILGVITTGEMVTITNSYISGISSGTGLSVYQYGGMELYIGKHYEKIEDIKFNHVQIQYSNLNVWNPFSGIKVNFDELLTNNALKVEHTPIESVTVNLDDGFHIELQKYLIIT